MEDLYKIHRMMFIGSGFGFEDLDDDTKEEILNKVFDYVKKRIKEHESSKGKKLQDKK